MHQQAVYPSATYVRPTGESHSASARLSDSERDTLEELAAQFAALFRRGSRPAIEDFAARYPEHAEEIRELFPLVLAMEERVHDPAHSSGACGVTLPVARLGDFQVLGEIGRGGMGVVYEAEQLSLGRRVAVKVLSRHLLDSEREVERFYREAQTAARLHHTNIVPIFAVGQEQGVHYIAMQLIQGAGLDAVFSELRRLVGPSPEDGANRTAGGAPGEPDSSPGRRNYALQAAQELARESVRGIARVGLQVASALSYAHAHGTLHRDIKPANLLLDREGLVWVADFGLAKNAKNVEHSQRTQEDDLAGTLRYMAPERFHSQADALSDIYSLGITLYELLTLEYAFKSESRSVLLRQIRNGELTPLRRKNPEVPRDLELIVLKATAREPEARYQSAAELARDLECFLEERPVTVRQLSARERVWQWCRRNPAAATLSGGALSLLLLVAVLASFVAVFAQRSYEREAELRERAEATAQLAVDVLEKAVVKLENALADPQHTADTHRRHVVQEFASQTYAALGRLLLHMRLYDEAATVLSKAEASDNDERSSGLRGIRTGDS